jgi:hypothetical protein
MLGKLREYTSTMSVLDPLNLHGLKCSTSDDLIDSAHYGYGCAVLKLLYYWAGLGKQTKKIEIIGFFHAKTISFFVLLSLCEIHNSCPHSS